MSITPIEKDVDVNTKRITLVDYALKLHQIGFNVVPMLSNRKSPALETWTDLCKLRQTEDDVRSLPWTRNIGIINGINGMRSLDLDECNDIEFVFKLLEMLGLPPDYPWIVASPGRGGGFHIHIQCEDRLTLTSAGHLVGVPLVEETETFKKLELRWSDCVTAFPPSIHPETKTRYTWAFGPPAATSLAKVPIKLVETTFLAIAKVQKKSTKEQTPTTSSQPTKIDAWAQKAFIQEIDAVRDAPSGQRNTQLNKSAFNLGQIVGMDLLNAKQVEADLTRAAKAAGLNEQEIEATIKSGLEAGVKKPRMPKQVFRDSEPKILPTASKNVDETKLVSFSADDQGHAEAVYSLYGQFLAYNDALGWMIWNGTHYTPSIQRINTLIVETLRKRLRAASHLERTELAKVSKAMAGTVAATRSMLENLAHVDVDQFDNEPDLINTHSGIVNLKTKKLIPHSPEYRFTWCSPVRYNPNADRSLWLSFVEETVESSEMVDYLQEALGYSISGHTSEECLFYIYGPPRSGKGTLSETFLAIFPRPIATEVDFNTFTQKREGDNQNFDLAPLKPARIVFASESNKYQSLNPAKIKALTGGNLVSCAHKYGAFFTYRPQYSVWLSSNHEVNGDADDTALWGRMRVIGFPHSRLGNEDKSLKTRMQDNLEGVLAWLIDGAYQWYQHDHRGLETPEAVRNLTQVQREGQDNVGLWLEECCEMKEGEWTENNRIMATYENWCKDNGYEPKKAKGLSQSLAAHGYEVGVLKRTPGEKVTRGVRNLILLS